MATLKPTVDLHKCHGLEELDRTLKNISRNVFEISNSKVRTKAEMKVKLAKLKREKIEAISLFGKCQAVLASMEVIIAQNELSEELSSLKLKDLKRKCSGTHESEPKSKKVKTTEGCKESTENAKSVTKSSKKTTHRSSKEKSPKAMINNKSEQVILVPPHLPINTHKKEVISNNTVINKQNCNYQSLPSVGKQIIVLGGPPVKNTNQIGYLTNGHQFRHNRIENSIYNLAQNTECFARKMTLMSNDSFQQKYVDVNQMAFSNQSIGKDFNNNESTYLNYNNLRSAPQNQHSTAETSKSKLNEECFNTNNNQSTKYELIKECNDTSSGEMECTVENLQTTNEIFNDIMSSKGVMLDKNVIKKENDHRSINSSEGTLCIDISI
ncbi:hypothetical protein evm_006290 [Chilo suppressalis]|nr:hypothetical protein evm_006290 [Chilo suppressalis]